MLPATVALDRAGSNPPSSPACSATAGCRLRSPRPAGTATSESSRQQAAHRPDLVQRGRTPCLWSCQGR